MILILITIQNLSHSSHQLKTIIYKSYHTQPINKNWFKSNNESRPSMPIWPKSTQYESRRFNENVRRLGSIKFTSKTTNIKNKNTKILLQSSHTPTSINHLYTVPTSHPTIRHSSHKLSSSSLQRYRTRILSKKYGLWHETIEWTLSRTVDREKQVYGGKNWSIEEHS